MNARDYRINMMVTVETTVLDGDSLETVINDIRERIISQLSGHRTPCRLADYVRIGPARIESEISRIVE